MEIKLVPGLGVSPARVNRRTGTIYLNQTTWHTFTPFEQKLIILHEKGHYLLQTKSEKKADEFAIRKFIGTEAESLRKSLKTFYNTLDMQNYAHQKRYNDVLKLILEIDFFRFKNEKTEHYLKIMYDKELQDLIVVFLKEKGIDSLSELTEKQRKALMVEFFNQTDTLLLLDKIAAYETENGSNYEGSELEGPEYSDFVLALGSLIAGAGMLAKKAVGSGILKGVFGKIGGAFGFGKKKKDTEATNLAAAQAAVIEANRIAAEAERKRLEAEAKAKKQKIIMFGGIGAVLVIGIILFLVLKK